MLTSKKGASITKFAGGDDRIFALIAANAHAITAGNIASPRNNARNAAIPAAVQIDIKAGKTSRSGFLKDTTSIFQLMRLAATVHAKCMRIG